MSEGLIEALFNAARTNDIVLLTAFLTNPHSKQIISRNQETNSPLIAAIHNGSNEAVILLLDAKANPNQRDSQQRTALHHAVLENSELPIMQRLLEAKADANCQDHKGKTALYHQPTVLYSTNPIEKVKLLLAHHTNVRLADKDGNTPLHVLTCYQPPACHILINLLVAAKADVNKQNKEGFTPLIWGTYRDQGSALHLHTLLSKNANPMLKDRNGWLAIECALRNEHLAAVKVLAEAKNCDLNKPGIHGHPALHQSMFFNFQSTSMLLSVGKVDVNKKNEEGDTPLHIAIKNFLSIETARKNYPHAALVQLLLAYKANPNVKDKRGHTPFALLPKPTSTSSSTELLVRNLLLTRMAKPALLTGLLPRPGAKSPLHLAASRLICDKQVFRIIWASAFGPGLDKRKPPEQQMFLQALQQFSIDLPETLLCSKSVTLPFSLIYATSAEATVACERLKKILGADLAEDPVSLKVEESTQGWIFSISQQQYEALLTLRNLATEPHPSGSVCPASTNTS